jgi:hypothetical protein
MKTAKELCEEKRASEIENIITAVRNSILTPMTISTLEYAGEYYNNEHFYKKILTNKSKLIELGYKVEIKRAKVPVRKRIQVKKPLTFLNRLFKSEPKLTWTTEFEDREIEYAVVSACCGENETY